MHELERLTFVPAAEARLHGFAEPLADVSLKQAIVIDLFEFSRRDGLYYGFERGVFEEVGEADSDWSTDAAKGGAERLDWPLYFTFHEAKELAARRGMRLPTPREWLHVATGARSFGYPWHASTFQQGLANTSNLKLRTPSAVGVFEGGRSRPFGCYDLVGNVAEWVDGTVPGYNDSLFDSSEEPGAPDYASVMGGSYLGVPHRTFGHRGRSEGPELRFNAERLSRGFLAPTVGARMCADAEAYLEAQAPRWGKSSRDESRVRAVGARWATTSGREVVSLLLDELADRDGAPAQLRWLAEGAHENP